MTKEADPRELINSDGSSFAKELPALLPTFDALSNQERADYRARNTAAIVQHGATHLLIVSGPGSGKSFLFLDRIRHWLETQDDPQIYVSSFVRKLVNDLRNEIDAKIPEAGKQVEATTLHTFARSVIERSNGTEALRLLPHVHVIAGPWPDVVWRDVLAFHPDLAAGHTRSDRDAQYYDDELSKEEDWVGLVASYNTLRRFYNAVGFADMIVTAREAVEENPDLVEHSFWIIDEFQDFNRAEECLVRVATGNATQLLVAGDDEQALYQALKASHPEIIVSYYDDPTWVNAMLPYCSRCSQHICLAASAFIDQHRGDDTIAKAFLPVEVDPDAAKVKIVAAAAPGSAVNYVREFLEDRQEQLEEHTEQLRAGDETDPFLLILTPQKAVTFYGKAKEELFELVEEWTDLRFEHSDDYWRVANYCAAARSPEDNFAARKVLHHESVSTADVHELLVAALEQEISLSAVASDAVTQALDHCQEVHAVIDSEDLDVGEKADRCAELLSINDSERLASELEADAISSATDEGSDAIQWGGGASTVELMSIVGAKGLSAKHVIVLGCDDVNLGHTDQLAFYVALTRARVSLHLLVAAKAGGAKAPHDFLFDLPEECCEITVHKKSDADESLADMAALQKRLEVWSRYGH